jgi:Chaperone of endosialidase
MAIGTDALRDNKANFNLAIGFRVLFMNTTGNHLTGIGAAALRNNTTAGFNTAIGADALRENTTGINNTAIGADALAQNTIAEENTATGASALSSNNEGDFNTADGAFALVANTEGGRNTATGDSAMFSNTTGSRNTASGNAALGFNTTGNDNTAIGFGASPNTTGSSNIAVGAAAGSNVLAGNNNINIGSPGSNTSNAIRIGNGAHLATFIAGISGVNEGGSPTAVFINTATGQLGTTPPASSRRFKKEIKPMDQTSEAILGLKPVTFRYKSDSKDTPQFGLIAEEVAQIDPDLVVRDENGDIYTVRYDAVNAMLLNEFLKEHRELQELKKQVAALTAGLQKVSAQLEAGKPAPQVVNNP